MSDALWTVVLNLICAPLNVGGWLLGSFGEGLQWCAFRLDDASGAWLVRVRLWSGRNERGAKV